MATAAVFNLKLNWRGKLLIVALKVAVVLARLGLHRTAEKMVRRVMRELDRRKDWFDTEPVSPRKL